MKKISRWAKNHVWESRLLIVTSYILLSGIGLFTGKLLNDLSYIMPPLVFTLCSIITITLCVAYPRRKNTKHVIHSSSGYARRKTIDFSLGAITFLMIIYVGNNWKDLSIKSESAQAFNITHISKDSSGYNNPLIKNFIALIKNTDISKLNQREKLKLLKTQIRIIKHDKDTSKNKATGLIILSVIIALGLLFLVASLACSLSCSGSGALAIIVGLGGGFLIIFLLVRLIKHLNKRPEKKESPGN